MAQQLLKLGYLAPKNTVFFVCDIQERFRPTMKLFDHFVKNSSKLITAGKFLDIPMIATEQNPDKLGKTVKELEISHAKGVYPKTLFSMVIPPVETYLKESKDVNTVVLMGIEAHVCVEQTAMDLIRLGYTVHVAADCTMSRSLEDRALALERLKNLGCFISTSENIIFKLLKDKNHPAFNDVRKLVTEISVETGLVPKL